MAPLSRHGPVRQLAMVAGAAAVSSLAAWLARREWAARRLRKGKAQLEKWCERGPAKEPVIECQVFIPPGPGEEEPGQDAVDIPIGLIFECDRLKEELAKRLEVEKDDDVALVEALQALWAACGGDEEDAEADAPSLELSWIDLQALAQLTYWYDRRPKADGAVAGVAAEAQAVSQEIQKQRLEQAKYGRWTKKISREKVVYGAIALRYRTRGHLGEQVFRRPAGIDVTRLATLRRAASLCGHDDLLQLVETTMEQLQPRNVAKIPFAEVQKHSTKEDFWLLIDGKVYDVTPFLDLHPGGGELILEGGGKDSTSLFELTHGEGLRYSLRLLNQFFIGVCTDPQAAEPAEKTHQPTPEFLETLRSITGALHTFDEARATGQTAGSITR
eukprot:TRINITY_DN15240_c0_g1_i1.p1 TRINITY_DN15240_c0_g1~~TRINITY_DN15240_c0_g1_i1.p1  ORF type:complete len:387 (+),score=106.33 TRINITY_DN15240_c0_g1_i1:82-1242(+)